MKTAFLDQELTKDNDPFYRNSDYAYFSEDKEVERVCRLISAMDQGIGDYPFYGVAYLAEEYIKLRKEIDT